MDFSKLVLFLRIASDRFSWRVDLCVGSFLAWTSGGRGLESTTLAFSRFYNQPTLHTLVILLKPAAYHFFFYMTNAKCLFCLRWWKHEWSVPLLQQVVKDHADLITVDLVLQKRHHERRERKHGARGLRGVIMENLTWKSYRRWYQTKKQEKYPSCNWNRILLLK